ncbi:MAG: putative rane protein [Pseudomonas sp.]|nr:putative rane protein [Pseudomonas sp.]
MTRPSKGFGLIEIMIAMSLGLLITLGLIQLFISSKNTYVSQHAAASVQEDARFILSKMVQDIRAAGMFGCLATVEDASATGDFLKASKTPILWNNAERKLTLITAAEAPRGVMRSWVVHSDCTSSATAYSSDNAPNPGADQVTFPVREVTYAYKNREQELTLDGEGVTQNVSAFTVLFGVASTPDDTHISHYRANPDNPALIRSVRLSITLVDPTQKSQDQTFTVIAALRNRLG